MIKLKTPVIMNDHIRYPSGKCKTVCVTACLTAIGVPFDGFKVTGNMFKANYLSVLNNHGFTARSRKSKMPKSLTIGACRKAIKKLDENTIYFVIVSGSGYCHAMLLGGQGQTLVDTDPRKADKRKIYSIHAVGRFV